MELTLFEQLIYSVIQITMLDENGTPRGTASGFIGSFCDNPDKKTHVPVIVTNRHVLSNCNKISVVFTRATESNEPDRGHTVSAVISTAQSVFHPDIKTDLAVLPLAQTFYKLDKEGAFPFFRYLPLSLIPSSEEWEQFDAIEEVIMAGYPRGIRDPVNNLPILRRGITATHPSYNFNGTPEFLVDMPCFEGCSGSPVFIIQQGAIFDPRKNSVNIGKDRIFLLGVQHAIPLSQAVGSLELLPSEQPSIVPKPVVPMYLNLGYIVKSTELLAFDDILRVPSGL